MREREREREFRAIKSSMKTFFTRGANGLIIERVREKNLFSFSFPLGRDRL